METITEVFEEILDIMQDKNYVEEPAGHGCGYGFTEDGQAEIMEVIKRILPQKEKEVKIMAATHVVVEELAFEVTAVETTQVLHETSGVLVKIGRKFHAHRKDVIAVSAKAARSKIERQICAGLEDDAAEALVDRLEVHAEKVNFPG